MNREMGTKVPVCTVYFKKLELETLGLRITHPWPPSVEKKFVRKLNDKTKKIPDHVNVVRTYNPGLDLN